MWILTAVFQAIAQALTWVFPVSESGHSAIFHNFSGRFTDACSQLTGVVHIGIAVGILLAFAKLFIRLFKNFFATFSDIFHKRLDVKNPQPQRKFMYMTVLSFVPMLIYLIPAGKYGSVYGFLNSFSYNKSVFEEGIFILLGGLMLFVTQKVIDKPRKRIPSALQSLIIGVFAFIALPVAGCSPVTAVFCVAVLVGLSDKYALRYCAVMSVPILIVGGIIEICTGVTGVNAVAAVLAVLIAAVVAYFAVKLFFFVLKNKALNYFVIYDAALGLICIIVGIFQLVLR